MIGGLVRYGVIWMRSALAFGRLIALCATADAETVHRSARATCGPAYRIIPQGQRCGSQQSGELTSATGQIQTWSLESSHAIPCASAAVISADFSFSIQDLTRRVTESSRIALLRALGLHL